ncbi:MAG: protein kinase domain-containing protein, partial [Planctomycetia bacterium]
VRDRLLQRELAMKVLRGEPSSGATPLPGSARDSQRVRRFLGEARLTAKLDHPGIVPVHELGVDAHGTPFFTMRLVRGSSLADVLKAARAGDRHWTLSRVLEVMLKVCDAVAYAHSQGVVHRDLKPTNIMVGAFGETYVMDWGLARGGEMEEHPGSLSSFQRGSSDDPITDDGDVLGTPNYMPPEQASGVQQQVGPRSDVYALGAILYQLLTGRPPFADLVERGEAPTVLAALLKREPTPIRVLAPHAPKELVAVAEKAMSRDAGDRYPDSNVSEWAADHYWPSYLWRFRKGDALQDSGPSGARVLRGGGAVHEAPELRTARRFSAAPDNRQPFVGVRAARALDTD